MSTEHFNPGPAVGDPFAAFEQTPALLAACKALQPTQLPSDSVRMFAAAFSAMYDADPADPSIADELVRSCNGRPANLAADALSLKIPPWFSVTVATRDSRPREQE